MYKEWVKKLLLTKRYCMFIIILFVVAIVAAHFGSKALYSRRLISLPTPTDLTEWEREKYYRDLKRKKKLARIGNSLMLLALLAAAWALGLIALALPAEKQFYGWVSVASIKGGALFAYVGRDKSSRRINFSLEPSSLTQFLGIVIMMFGIVLMIGAYIC